MAPPAPRLGALGSRLETGVNTESSVNLTPNSPTRIGEPRRLHHAPCIKVRVCRLLDVGDRRMVASHEGALRETGGPLGRAPGRFRSHRPAH